MNRYESPRGTHLPRRGYDFWTSIPRERQAQIYPELEQINQWLSRQFPQGYVSPASVRAERLNSAQNFDRQTDEVSCTYHALANAMRLLRSPHPDYSMPAIRRRYSTLGANSARDEATGREQQLFDSGAPYDTFSLEKLDFHMTMSAEFRSKSGIVSTPTPQRDFVSPRGTSDGMLQLLRAFQNGSVGTLGWDFNPNSRMENGLPIHHRRTIVGFHNTHQGIMMEVLDPYQPITEVWALPDLVAAYNRGLFLNGEPAGANAGPTLHPKPGETPISKAFDAIARDITLISTKIRTTAVPPQPQIRTVVPRVPIRTKTAIRTVRR